MIITCVVLIQCQGVTDRHTDRRAGAFAIAKTGHLHSMPPKISKHFNAYVGCQYRAECDKDDVDSKYAKFKEKIKMS